MNKCAFRHGSHPVKGFTLVELLVTLAILTILMVIGVPAMQGFLQSRQASARADEIAASLKFTRSEAIKHSQRVAICRTTNPDSVQPSCNHTSVDWMSGWLVFVDANHDGDYQTSELLLKVQQAFTGQGSINGAERTQQTLTFTPDGLAIGSNTSFIVAPDANSDSHKRCVVLSAQGRVRLTAAKKDAQGKDDCE